MSWRELPLLPRSYAASLLIAFALVILPLAIALVHAVVQIHAFAADSRLTAADALVVGEQSRVLRDALLAMERAVRQSKVVNDPALIERYATQRRYFTSALTQLAAVDAERRFDEAVIEISLRERAVYRALRERHADDALAALQSVQTGADDLITAADRTSTDVRHLLNEQPTTISLQVVRLAALALPLAIVLAAWHTWRLGRPVRRLASAIRKLGAGDWQEPIRVTGHRDVAALGDRLEWLRQRLGELQAARQRFLQGVSHDLKTPLAAIAEGASILNDELCGPLTQKQRALIGVVDRNADELLRRIERLLRASAPALASASPALGRVDLRALVERVVDDHRFSIGTKQLRVDPKLTDATVTGDAEQLRMIIDNLVSNAVKYSPPAGSIELALRDAGDAVLLEISDDGPGVAIDERDRIFDRSTRGRAAALTMAPGTGVGLAIAREFALAHGGSLSLSTHSGRRITARSARFVLKLPMNREIERVV